MAKGLATAAATLIALLLVPAAAPARTLLPWPNDQFMKLDKRTDTGLRLNLKKSDMPRNFAIAGLVMHMLAFLAQIQSRMKPGLPW